MMILYTVYKWEFFWFTDVDSGGGDREEGFLTGQQLLVIIIVGVVVGIFILVVCLILIIKCAVRNKLSKDDYMHVRGRKPAHVWVTIRQATVIDWVLQIMINPRRNNSIHLYMSDRIKQLKQLN